MKHILDAIATIEIYLREVDETKFGQDKLRQDGVIRQLEIIGEATKNLTTELREENRRFRGAKSPAYATV